MEYLGWTFTTCGSCGTTEESDADFPDSKSREVEAKLTNQVDAESTYDMDYAGAPHPLCRSCFVGWLHNFIQL